MINQRNRYVLFSPNLQSLSALVRQKAFILIDSDTYSALFLQIKLNKFSTTKKLNISQYFKHACCLSDIAKSPE